MNKLTILFLFLASGFALAGNQAGEIRQLAVSGRDYAPPYQNPTHVSMAGVYNDKPSCATSGYWAIDTETDQGRVILTLLLTAYASGKNVTLWGTGNCNLWPEMETVFQAGFESDQELKESAGNESSTDR